MPPIDNMSITDDKKIEFMNLYSANPAKYEAETAKDILSLSIKTFSPKNSLCIKFWCRRRGNNRFNVRYLW